MISFEESETLKKLQAVVREVAIQRMRPISRYFDEHEGEIPWDYVAFMHEAMKTMGAASLVPQVEGNKVQPPNYVMLAHTIETLSWGDAGIYLCTPRGGLGAAAVEANGTAEQRDKFLGRLSGDKPVFTAMAITEAQAGSENSAIQCRAVFDAQSQEWVLNGEKIFVTAGHKALVDTPGFVVVWATIDPEAGRAGIRSFVIEAGTRGIQVTRQDKKLGIRASDTVTLTLQECRVPANHLLGEVKLAGKASPKGFKGAMQTFNVTRPLVAASALGIARAALDEMTRLLTESGVEIRVGMPRQKMSYVEGEVIDMQRTLRAAWLLTLKAAWLSDEGQPNALEAAMCKLMAGEVVTRVTQKAVEILGPVGYSRTYLLEKWLRDAKINDIYEGTGQINRLVAARLLLGYRGSELR
ncbi:MAG: acyl-CoA dehydrogenase [Chloroflexi bacterium]|nr:acyl-CoA dehydrogenase [Chloroflexota bacterium]